MGTKREVLARNHNLPIEQVCCELCDHKAEKDNHSFCKWFQMYCKNPKEDYCFYFFNSKLHK